MKGVNQYICGYKKARETVSRSVEHLFDGKIALTDDNMRKIEHDVSNRIDISSSCISVDIERETEANSFQDGGTVSVRFAVGGNVWYVDKEIEPGKLKAKAEAGSL